MKTEKNRKEFIENFGKSHSKITTNTFDNHLDIVEHIDNCFFKFMILSNRIRDNAKESIKELYLLAYTTSIANNFLVIKQLFATGFHFQMEIIERTQLEQLNNLLTMIYDDEFFQYFTKTGLRNNDDFIPLTPKEKHLTKALKKIQFKNQKFDKLFREYYDSMQEPYEEFSKSVHGNLMHILLLTDESNRDDEPMYFNLGGKENFIPRSINFLVCLLDYSQVIWFLIEEKYPKVENEEKLGNVKLLKYVSLSKKYSNL